MKNDLPPSARDRTIIRPNPGGRRPAPAEPLAHPTARPLSPSPAPSAPARADASEDWIQSRQAERPLPEQLPALPQISVDELAAPHENPIMRAAGPLLLLLGRLRVKLLRASFASLMEEVAEAVRFFEKDLREAGIPPEQAETAKYCLCATADDIVQNIPTDDRHVWTQYSMLSRFFGERTGGLRFFDELDRAKADPLRNYEVLELLYTSLALGFQGVHRTSVNGPLALQQIQRDVYELLRRVRPRVQKDLSPHWQGLNLGHSRKRLHVPVTAVYGVAGLGLLALYVTLRTLLGGSAQAASDHIRTIHPTGKLDIERRVLAAPRLPDPPSRSGQLQRIAAALRPEIAANQLSVAQTGNKILIRVGDLVLFPSGQATLKDEFRPIARKIAAALDKEPGAVTVVGHTDNVQISKVSRFKSNWELSLERAKAVATEISKGLSGKDRVEVEGKADEMPIAPNATREGRALNRRVEILLARTGD